MSDEWVKGSAAGKVILVKRTAEYCMTAGINIEENCNGRIYKESR